MNVLTEALPSTVEIGGRKYPINTDFRAGIAFEKLIASKENNAFKLLEPYFSKDIPEDVLGAFQAIEKFFCCGTVPAKKDKPTKDKIAYSFDVDSEAIFADFWQYYNIDLSQEGLHWWVFRALLFGLPEESSFKQRVYYRTCDTKGLSKREKERIVKIRKMYEIKDEYKEEITLEERDAQMLKYLEKRRNEIKQGGEVNG